MKARRLPAEVTAVNPKTGLERTVPPAQTVTVTGPEIAAADSQITAQVLLNLSTGLLNLVQIGALSQEAAQVAAQKSWEDYVGVPYHADLNKPDANPDDIATAIDDAAAGPKAGGAQQAPQVRRLFPAAAGGAGGSSST